MRFSYKIYRLFSSLHYWTQRRFTKAGLLVLGGIVLTLGLGADTERSAGYQLLAVLFGLLVKAMFWAPFFRTRFTVQRHLPRFGTVDQPLEYHLSITNHGSRSQRNLVLLEDLEDTRPMYEEYREQLRERSRHHPLRPVGSPRPWRFAHLRETLVSLIPAHGATEISAELTPLRRGMLRFKGVTLARPDPLGLFRGFVRTPLEQTVMILPKRYPLAPLALPGVTKYQQGGVALAGSVGESEEFVSLREYRRGDPLRHIHWKSWAKVGEPIVKEFQDEFFVRHGLILDTFAHSEKRDAFEEAVSIAASFASNIETQDSLLDLMFVGPEAFCFTSGRGVGHSEQMLQILASVQLCRDQSFRRLHDLVLEHTSALSGCVCIFLEWDQPRQKLVQHLNELDLPVLVFVVREADETAPLDLGPFQDKPDCLHSVAVGKVAEALRKIG